MSTDIERWMRRTEDTLAEHDRRIRSKPIGDPGGGTNPIGPAGGDLTGTYPNPTIGGGKVTSTHIADGTIVHGDVAAANKDGVAATPSMRTLGTGAQQAAAGNDPRLSDARAPTAHSHAGEDITSGTVGFARLPTGTTGSTVAIGNHTHNWDSIVAGGTLNVPIVQDRIATPGSIPAGAQALYPKDDGRYYVVGSDGVERPLIPSPDQLHANPHFDIVSMSTDGPGSSWTVTSRLYPDSWQNYWSSNDGTVELIADETVTLEGLGYSLKHVFNAATKQLIVDSTVFAVTPGALINVGAWVKGEATPGPYTEVRIYTKQDADPSVFDPNIGSSEAIVPGDGWQKINVSGIVPAGHNRCRFTLRSFSSGLGTTGTIWYDATESSMTTVPQAQVIPGTITMWPTASAPAGYLLCNGGTFSSTTYPTLATLLGDTYGTHSGTTYYLPDFRGRSPLGVGTASPAVPGGTAHTLAQKGGEETHAMTLAENGPHTHTGTTGGHSVDHSHTYSTGYSEFGGAPNWTFGNTASGARNFNVEGAWGTAGASNDHTHSFTTASSGSGTGHNTMHPYLGINFIIKT